jgi:hypothetical protein
MRRLFVLLIIGGTSLVQAQNIDTLLSQLNQQLDAYQNINPFESQLTLDDTELSPIQKIEFRQRTNDDDSISPLDLQDYYYAGIDSLFRAIMLHPEVNSLDLNNRINCSVLESKDACFLQFSFDENTGGTYQSRAVFYFSRAHKEDSYRAIEASNYFRGEERGLMSDGYSEVNFLGTQADTSYYFFTHHVRGCNSCFGNSFGLLAMDSGRVFETYSFSVDSRSWEIPFTIDFNENDSLITVLYAVDDLSGDCYCGEYEDQKTFKEDYLEGESKYCRFVFRYHNFKFFLIENSSIYPDPIGKPLLEDK